MKVRATPTQYDSKNCITPSPTSMKTLVFLFAAAAAAPLAAQQHADILWWKGGHTGVIRSVAFSPDGQLLASGGVDNTLKLWSAADGSLLRTLTGASGNLNVTKLAFSADSRTLVTLSYNGACCVLNPADGTLQRLITNPFGVNFSAISPDGTLVACASGGGVMLYRTDNGSLSLTVTNQTLTVSQAAFCPDSATLAVAYSDGTVTFWHVADGTQDHSWGGWFGDNLTYSPDGQTLACGGGAGMGYLGLRRVSDGQVVWWNSAATYGSVVAVAFSPDGQTVASAGNASNGDPAIRLWRASDGTLARNVQVSDVNARCIAFLPDGATLASGGQIINVGAAQTVIRFWNVANGALSRTLTGHHSTITALAFSRDGSVVASAGTSADRTVRLWQTSDGTQLRTMSGLTAANGLAFSPGNLTLVGCGCTGSDLIGWRVANGTQAWSTNIYPWQDICMTGSATSNLLALAQSYYGSANQTRITLRRFTDGQEVQNIVGFTNSVPSLSFSPDGTLLASACFDKTVKLWQVPTTNLVRTLSVGSEVWSVGFSPDGTSLATGSSNGVVKLWRTLDGALLRTLSGHTQAVMGVIFSSDGASLLSAGCDSTLRVWRVANGGLLTTYDSEVLQPASLASDPAQRLFVYGRTDATLVLGRWPTPRLQAWPAVAGVQVQLSGLTGEAYTIQTSSNLQYWSDWTNFTATNALTLLADPDASAQAAKFYRARVQ